MKQLEIIDQEIILYILKFYEDIGINLHIDHFQNETKKDILANSKYNSKKKSKDIIINDVNQEEASLNGSDDIDVLENLFKNSKTCS